MKMALFMLAIHAITGAGDMASGLRSQGDRMSPWPQSSEGIRHGPPPLHRAELPDTNVPAAVLRRTEKDGRVWMAIFLVPADHGRPSAMICSPRQRVGGLQEADYCKGWNTPSYLRALARPI